MLRDEYKTIWIYLKQYTKNAERKLFEMTAICIDHIP